MFWFNIIYKIIKVFKGGATPGQISAGLTLGVILGLTPGWPAHMLALLLIVLILNVNLTLFLVGIALGKVVGWALDPAFDALGGYALLNIDSLKGLYTAMYNSPFWMLTRFNNTLVMGGFVAALLFSLPLYFLFRILATLIQSRLIPKFQDSKIAKAIKKSWLFGIYSKIDAVGSTL